MLIELDGARLLTDPLLRKRIVHLRRVVDVPPGAGSDTDAVLISHLHYDHLDLASLGRLDRSTQLIVPRGAGSLVARKGFRNVVEVEPGDSVAVKGVTVQATHAEHDGNRGPLGAKARAVGFLVAGTGRVYFAGDTDLFDRMSDLAPLDVAILPVAGWGPRVPAGHLDPRRAAQALALLRPRVAVPVHWGTYRRIGLSRDPAVLREPAESFVELAAELAPDVDVRVVDPGGSVDID